jgi:uncharacterized membrane protein
MTTNRLEAFSDGVLAIIITIMVLELKQPEGNDFKALISLLPKFLSYIFSFIYVGIYWNNHHHLFQAIEKINGKILLANLNLLFWLSFIPFATDWIGESNFASNPTTLYCFILLMSAISFLILEKSVIKSEGKNTKIGIALGSHQKEKISLLLYTFSFILSFYYSIISLIIVYAIAILWIIPDERIEKVLN